MQVVNGNAVLSANQYWKDQVTAGKNFSDFSWDDNLKEAFAVHFFHLLWTVQFFVYFTYLVCHPS